MDRMLILLTIPLFLAVATIVAIMVPQYDPHVIILNATGWENMTLNACNFMNVTIQNTYNHPLTVHVLVVSGIISIWIPKNVTLMPGVNHVTLEAPLAFIIPNGTWFSVRVVLADNPYTWSKPYVSRCVVPPSPIVNPNMTYAAWTLPYGTVYPYGWIPTTFGSNYTITVSPNGTTIRTGEKTIVAIAQFFEKPVNVTIYVLNITQNCTLTIVTQRGVVKATEPGAYPLINATYAALYVPPNCETTIK
jgi:hypothetical protein